MTIEEIKILRDAEKNGETIQIKINCLNMFDEYDEWLDIINFNEIFDDKNSELHNEDYRIKPKE